MSETGSTSRRVFISYSRENKDHDDAVLALAQGLRKHGIDAWMDRFERAPPQGWPRWIMNQVEDAEYVLLVCTPTYKQRFDGREMGHDAREVTFEGLLTTQRLYDGKFDLTRLIPVVLRGGTADAIPNLVRGATRYLLDRDYGALVERLLGRPGITPVSLDEPEVLTGMPDAPSEHDQLDTLLIELQRKEIANEDVCDLRNQIFAERRRLRAGKPFARGDLLGARYRLLNPAGRGGFGTIWEAWDCNHRNPEERGRKVAVKILHHHWSGDRTQIERFARGARKMADLRHPGIVPVLEGHIEDDNCHFYVMQWMSGGNLRQRIAEKNISKNDILRSLATIANALNYIHVQGMVHRDVTPNNILFDAKQNAALSDFDLIKAPHTTQLTEGGSGTFLYSAPEQLHDASRVSKQADVYGLGMTALYCILERDPPALVDRADPELLANLDCSRELSQAISHAVKYLERDRAPDCSALARALLASGSEPSNTTNHTRAFQKKWKPIYWIPLSLIGVTVLSLGRIALRSNLDDPPTGGPTNTTYTALEDTAPMTLIELSGGKFTMGSPDRVPEFGRGRDEIRHRVSVSPFAICQTEVTAMQYSQVMNDPPHGCIVKNCYGPLPVHRVSWYDAARFTNELTRQENARTGDSLTVCYDETTWKWDRTCTGYRLPTEAEWEYAARAGSVSAWPSGALPDKICAQTHVNSNECGHHRVAATSPDELSPNNWNLYAMHGNLWEWVYDQYAGYESHDGEGIFNGTAIDPAIDIIEAGVDIRVVRGGAFNTEPDDTRSANRGWQWAQKTSESIGFRCARSVFTP
ncbi:SUMF1/EgtB/PvdO family nonheme iron enzyme [Nannocystaceae bacterium ST9]